LLFELWFEAEYFRAAFDIALEVAAMAIQDTDMDHVYWYERMAQVHVTLAQRAGSGVSRDASIREVDNALRDLRLGKEVSVGSIQATRMDMLIEQARALRARLSTV
jgi:hypothetical protein